MTPKSPTPDHLPTSSEASATPGPGLGAEGPVWRNRLGELGQHFVRAGRDETRFDARQVLVRTMTNALPHLSFNRTRTALLRASGVRLGYGALVMGPLNVTGPGNLKELLSIGDHTFITGPLHVDLGAPVRIGSCVRMGHHVVLLTVDHEIGPAEYRCGRLVAAPITIGDGVWIGSCVTILPGVTIGSGAVIAAGATVVRDVPKNTLAGGVPAKVVRDLDTELPPASVRRGRSTPLED